MNNNLLFVCMITASLISGCCTSISSVNDDAKLEFNELDVDCLARSPEVLIVGRLYRGVDPNGQRVYGSELIDQRKVCFSLETIRFGSHYQLAIFNCREEGSRFGKFTLPVESEPMGFAYAHISGEKFLVVCHKDPSVGIADTGPYRLSNDDSNNAIGYVAVEYIGDPDTPIDLSEVDFFSIAEPGFCINRSGELLVPGNLENGEIYR